MHPEYVILHTAAHGKIGDNGEPPALFNTTFKQIDNSHKQLGWSGFGYHGLVDLYGKFFKGRNENKKGAHCTSKNMNSKSLGLCMSGHGDFYQWTEPQYRTMLKTVHNWRKKYSIPINNVLGHYETGAKKTCPGTRINMNKVREDLQLYEISLENKTLSPIAKTYISFAFKLIYSEVVWKCLPQQTQSLINKVRHSPIFNFIKGAD